MAGRLRRAGGRGAPRELGGNREEEGWLELGRIIGVAGDLSVGANCWAEGKRGGKILGVLKRKRARRNVSRAAG